MIGDDDEQPQDDSAEQDDAAWEQEIRVKRARLFQGEVEEPTLPRSRAKPEEQDEPVGDEERLRSMLDDEVADIHMKSMARRQAEAANVPPPTPPKIESDFSTFPSTPFRKSELDEEVYPPQVSSVVPGCWAFDYIGLFWPEQISNDVKPLGGRISFPSSNTGWYWHNFCLRAFVYTRDTSTEVLSTKKVWLSGLFTGDFIDTIGIDPEYFEGSGDTTNWYNPSAADVTAMVGYIPATDCSGSDTGTMEVAFRVRMFRERQWREPPPYGPEWDNRTDETGSWPQILEFGWRYI